MNAAVKKRKKKEVSELNFLTPLKGEIHQKGVIGFDVETHSIKNRFVLGVISYPDQRGNRVFHDPELMLAELGHYRNHDYLIYATNLHFDIFALFQEVAKEFIIPEGWEAFDNGAKLIWARKKLEQYDRIKYVTVLDSLNLFPLGVYNLGEILQKVHRTYEREKKWEEASYFNAKKLKAPDCMGKKRFEALTDKERNALEDYCAADAEVTRKFMEWANGEIIKLGAMPRITAASTAMDLFRRQYLKQPIPQPNYVGLCDARYSYYGGRTEDYFKGNVGAGFEHDVTAMYPSVMQELEFPYPSPETFCKVNLPSEEVIDYEGFTKCVISVPHELYFPPLPFRAPNHLLFPTGRLEGVWTNLQLRHAIAMGCNIEKLIWSYYTQKVFNPFKGYIDELIKLRMHYLCPGCESFDRTGKHCWELGVKCVNAYATEEVIKLFQNGLYGKFCQNFLSEEEGIKLKLSVKKGGGTFKPIHEASKEELEFTMQNHADYLDKGLVLSSLAPSVKRFMNPILGSYVTSAAQCKINDFQWKAYRLGIPTFYTDTDSMLNPKVLPFASKGKHLGQLQIASAFDELIIVGPKAKLTKSGDKFKPTFKGVPNKSWLVKDSIKMIVEEVSPKQDMFRSMQKNRLKATFTRMAKVREAMVRGLSVNEMIQVTKEYDPFADPKRRIIGKPSIKSLLHKSYETVPWKVNRTKVFE